MSRGTKNFPHLTLENRLQLTRAVILKSVRVREKCFTIIRVRFRRALWVERASDKKFGRVIRRLSWRIIRARAIYFYPRANGIKSLPGKRQAGSCALPINVEQKSKRKCVWEKERVLRSAVDTGRREMEKESDGKNE